MFELKSLSEDGVPAALAKAERYRLLNEPHQAESICLDVLEIEPENQQALITLLLALTDQFGENLAAHVGPAREVLPRLHDEYNRAYYAGIICERRAKAHLQHGGLGSRVPAYEWFQEAMAWYERAETVRPPGNDDAILRWNTCARVLNRHPELTPAPEQPTEPLMLE